MQLVRIRIQCGLKLGLCNLEAKDATIRPALQQQPFWPISSAVVFRHFRALRSYQHFWWLLTNQVAWSLLNRLAMKKYCHCDHLVNWVIQTPKMQQQTTNVSEWAEAKTLECELRQSATCLLTVVRTFQRTVTAGRKYQPTKGDSNTT